MVVPGEDAPGGVRQGLEFFPGLPEFALPFFDPFFKGEETVVVFLYPVIVLPLALGELPLSFLQAFLTGGDLGFRVFEFSSSRSDLVSGILQHRQIEIVFLDSSLDLGVHLG